jgi:hypothetical protein
MASKRQRKRTQARRASAQPADSASAPNSAARATATARQAEPAKVLYEHFCDLYGDRRRPAPEDSSWYIAPERFELALTAELKGVFDELHAEYPEPDNIDISQRIAELQNAGCTHAPAQFAREAYIDQTPGGIYRMLLADNSTLNLVPGGEMHNPVDVLCPDLCSEPFTLNADELGLERFGGEVAEGLTRHTAGLPDALARRPGEPWPEGFNVVRNCEGTHHRSPARCPQPV